MSVTACWNVASVRWDSVRSPNYPHKLVYMASGDALEVVEWIGGQEWYSRNLAKYYSRMTMQEMLMESELGVADMLLTGAVNAAHMHVGGGGYFAQFHIGHHLTAPQIRSMVSDRIRESGTSFPDFGHVPAEFRGAWEKKR